MSKLLINPQQLNSNYGTQSPILFSFQTVPVLEPNFVADEIVKAILIEQEYLFLPWWLKWILGLKPFITMEAQFALYRAFGAYGSMDEFTGKEKNKK
jgi:hypothetical protein